jgi:DNA polymerase-3 subunit alpha
MWEFSSRTDVKMGGKKSLEALAYSGAFDSITPNRSIAISCVNDILKSSSSLTNQSSGDLFAGITNTADPYERYFNIEEISFSDFLEYEKKAFGYYFSGHPVMAISTIADKLSSTSIIKLNINSKKAKIVCLVNSVRQIRDRKGKPLTFMNLSDGTGTMDGIVSSELYENSFKFIKEGKIIVVSGSIEFDEYRSREKSMDMFRMRVSSITEMDDELTLKITKVIVNIEKSNFNSLESFSDAILSINESFWTDGKCLISAKIKQSNSEAMIDLGHKFKFAPTVENITFLEDMLGKNAIDI